MHSPRARILALQEARCRAYEEWEAAFRRFIAAGAEEEPYAQACKGATTEFARISAAIRVVEEELKTDSGDGAGLAQWVRKLQQAEQSKLQLTIGTQVERKRLAGVHEAVDLVGKAAGLPAVERRGVDMAMSVAHAHANGEEGGGGCSCASIQKELRELEQEMTQRQEDTVKLMQTDLDKLVADINETLDEIRYWGSD